METKFTNLAIYINILNFENRILSFLAKHKIIPASLGAAWLQFTYFIFFLELVSEHVSLGQRTLF